MRKEMFLCFIVAVFAFALLALSAPHNLWAQEEAVEEAVEEAAEVVVSGQVSEIAEDGSYIIIEETKILTPEEFLAGSDLAVGDNLDVVVEETDAGLEAVISTTEAEPCEE